MDPITLGFYVFFTLIFAGIVWMSVCIYRSKGEPGVRTVSTEEANELMRTEILEKLFGINPDPDFTSIGEVAWEQYRAARDWQYSPLIGEMRASKHYKAALFIVRFPEEAVKRLFRGKIHSAIPTDNNLRKTARVILEGVPYWQVNPHKDPDRKNTQFHEMRKDGRNAGGQ